MTRAPAASRTSRSATLLFVLLLSATAAALLPARPALAHPLNEYLVSSYLSVSPARIGVEIDLSPGVLVAPSVLPTVDTDGDEQLSDAEGRAYAERVLQQVQIAVDGRPLTLALDDVTLPEYRVAQAGYGSIKVLATGDGAPSASGTHQLTYRNAFTPTNVTYQVNAVLEQDGQTTLGQQQRDTTQRSTRISYTLGNAADTAPGASSNGSSRAPVDEQARSKAPGSRLAGYLEGSLSLGAVVAALFLAAVLGALHALTPGHAKTLMAAYLVGSGGTARGAVTLGAVVTFTHTASVVIIGLVALLASDLLVPGLLVPALEITAGLIVLVLGLRLLRQRWPARVRNTVPLHDHVLVPAGAPGAGISGRHDHHHDATHSHGGRAHSHALPEGGLTGRNLIAMGVSGGLVPCPEALGVMILAVGVDRTVLGLGMIVSFSLGLAAVLIGLGLVLVRSRSVLARVQGLDGRWLTVLPLLSAAVVTVLGLGLLLKGLGVTDLPL